MEDISALAKGFVAQAASLNGHTPRDFELLASVKQVTMTWTGNLGKMYGEALYGNPKNQGVLSKFNRGDREQGFAVWFDKMASGQPGEGFWAETALVGFMHASAGVDNGSVLAVMSKVQEALFPRCVEAFKGRQAMDVYFAFKRVLDVAVSVMIDAYEVAIATGMGQLGINEKLQLRMRTVAIRKMVDNGRDSLPLMDWSDALSVNVAEVDRQHKVLIDILNQLHKGAVSGKNNATLGTILDELANYTKNHFGYEEKVLQEQKYPEFGPHKESHDRLAGQVIKFVDEFKAGSGSLSGELFMFLRGWLNGHIRGSDRLYAKFLNEKGIH